MKNFNIVLFLFLLSVVFAGCEKEKEDETPKDEPISLQSWKLAEVKLNSALGEADVYPLLPACQKDNFLKFATGGKVTLDEGTDKCAGAAQTQQGSWSMAGTELTIDGSIFTALGLPSAAPRKFTIVEVSNQTLKLSSTEPITLSVPGVPFPVTATSTNLTFKAL